MPPAAPNPQMYSSVHTSSDNETDAKRKSTITLNDSVCMDTSRACAFSLSVVSNCELSHQALHAVHLHSRSHLASVAFAWRLDSHFFVVFSQM